MLITGKKISWKWKTKSLTRDFGEPASGVTNNVLCVYEDEGGGDTLLMQTALSGGEFWFGSSNHKNFRYRNKDGLPDGLTKARLRGSVGGTGLVKIVGKDTTLANLVTPPLPIGAFATVTTQLVNGGGDCWQAEYDTPARANTANRFRAKFKQ